MCASVVTLIMQNLCDAISKGRKSSNKPQRETLRLCTLLLVHNQAQNEGRRHATDTPDISRHMLGLCATRRRLRRWSDRETREGQTAGSKKKRDCDSPDLPPHNIPMTTETEERDNALAPPAAIYIFFACVGQEWVCVLLMNASEADWVKRPALLLCQSSADATPQKCHLSVQNNLSPRSPPDWLWDFSFSAKKIMQKLCKSNAIFRIFNCKYFVAPTCLRTGKTFYLIHPYFIVLYYQSISLFKGHI